jgi:hypothetical protein
MKNSTTIILPEWFAILDRMEKTSKENKKQPLRRRVMPRDVATRWNSTYDMLDFAYKYRQPYNKICSNRDMKMRSYELSNSEWKIVKDLSSVLKVRIRDFLYNFSLIFLLDLQGCYVVLFALNSQYCEGNSCYGSY